MRGLWIFERPAATTPREVVYDPARVQRWRPEMLRGRRCPDVGR